MLLALPLPPASHLLLADLEEEDLLLAFVELRQQLGFDVHVLEDLLQHLRGRVPGEPRGFRERLTKFTPVGAPACETSPKLRLKADNYWGFVRNAARSGWMVLSDTGADLPPGIIGLRFSRLCACVNPLT